MSEKFSTDHLQRLIRELRRLPAETSWVEFKHNNDNPDLIGELITSLSNAAALDGKETAWVVWGIEDGTHKLVGTSFVPGVAKKGNQDLESWLVQNMSPRLHIRFHTVEVEQLHLVMLEVPAARNRPTRFQDKELIRIGSSRRVLKDMPEREQALWRHFDQTPFEKQVALVDQSDVDVLKLLDHAAFVSLLDLPPPASQAATLAALNNDDLIRPNDAGHWDITNLGAILFARNLNDFPTLARKAVRLVVYKDRGRMETEREQLGTKGYAIGFEGLMDFLNALLPRNEVIDKALRKEVPLYPDLALRELIANALIHQDFTVTGTGPMVEVFQGRIEISNPGTPLGDIDRLLDQAPRSRNEALAAIMRRIGLCEERGSGVDKVVFQTELYQLPPPRWEVTGDTARALLFAQKELREMDKAECVHACYLHACLLHVQREAMTNSSLRRRFGIEERNKSQASRIIKDAVEEGVVKPYDPEQGRKFARYLPFWA